MITICNKDVDDINNDNADNKFDDDHAYDNNIYSNDDNNDNNDDDKNNNDDDKENDDNNKNNKLKKNITLFSILTRLFSFCSIVTSSSSISKSFKT